MVVKTTAEQSGKLMRARCRLMTREPWYGHVSMSMIWIPSMMPWRPEEQRTMGVRIVNGGDIQCLYYPPFVDSLTIKELFAVIQHEIEHIVRCHCLRVGHRHPEAWNIAADMCVNGRRGQPRIGYKDPATNEVIVPLQGNIIWIPDGWPADQTAEHYYEKLEKIAGPRCPRCGKSAPGKGGKGGGKGGGKSDKGKGGNGGKDGSGQGDCCPDCGQSSGQYNYGGVQGGVIDDHSVWNQTEVSMDEARQIVKDIVDQATQKCQGKCPGHLESAIQDLAKPIIRWRELLKHYLGKHVGNQRTTFSRRNRRRREFGVAGISHHAAAKVCVVVDTSGSIGQQELSQFFAEIDQISAKAKVAVLQWDHAFQGYEQYRRGDWKRFTVKGRGGTDMAAPIEWLMENHLVPDCVVMLTDGYCNYADDKKFPYICVVTTDQPGPSWGHTVKMKVSE